MGDQPEPIESLVARRIREQLDKEGIESLIAALDAVQEAVPSGRAAGTFGWTGAARGKSGPTAGVTVEPLSGELTFVPGTAEVTVTSDQVVDAMRSASPDLANDMQVYSPQDITAAMNFYAGLINLILAFVGLYQVIHGAPPPQQHIDQFFNQTTNYIVINVPPPHG